MIAWWGVMLKKIHLVFLEIGRWNLYFQGLHLVQQTSFLPFRIHYFVPFLHIEDRLQDSSLVHLVPNWYMMAWTMGLYSKSSFYLLKNFKFWIIINNIQYFYNRNTRPFILCSFLIFLQQIDQSSNLIFKYS